MVAGAAILTGCSYSARFVLVNESREDVSVNYCLQQTEVLLPIPIVRVGTIDQLKQGAQELEATRERFTIVEEPLSYGVTVKPGEVLYMTSVDIRDIKDEPVLKAGVSKLVIKNASGSASYEGDQVFPQFVPGRPSWFFGDAYLLYTITYK